MVFFTRIADLCAGRRTPLRFLAIFTVIFALLTLARRAEDGLTFYVPLPEWLKRRLVGKDFGWINFKPED